MNVDNVTVSGTADAATLKRIRRLLSTPAGTVPFDRAFGVDTSSIDSIPTAIEGGIMVAYSRAMLDCFPDYSISDISFEVDGDKITPTVVIADA
jgi:hypothetical protein